MSKIVLWNAIASRRRSISDTFYDNGLATLRGYLQDKGHAVEVVDWARDDFYDSLSPKLLSRWLRKIYATLLRMQDSPYRKLLGLSTLPLQSVLSFVQDSRLRRKIKALVLDLKKKGVRIVGVKVWYGQAFSNAKYFISLLKRIAPQIITVAGGYHVTLYEEHLMRQSDFDLGVVCEGEFALEKILRVVDEGEGSCDKQEILKSINALAAKGQIENLIYRNADGVLKTKRREVGGYSAKSIPRYSIDEYKVRIHVMVESLGCDWGKCHFCVHPYFYPRYSLRDPQEIVSEIEAMMRQGIGIFRFAGSDTPPAFGAKLAQRIIEGDLKIVFGMGSRAIRGAKNNFQNLVDSYSILIKAGLRSVFMGGETGNDTINQEAMNKGVLFEDIVQTVRALRVAQDKTGEQVFLSLALIYPAPLLGLTSLSQVKEDNLRLVSETQPDSVMITPPGPFLHTRWYEQKEKFGFSFADDIVKRAMEYEYVLYKPPRLWPELGIELEGRPFKVLLEECNDLRSAVENGLKIPTDISDEHFLMFYAAGLRKKEEILKVKNDTMLDVISCDYRISRQIASKVNDFSGRLAKGIRP